MSTALEMFFPNLRADVPGCPEPSMRRELLNALDEFCTRTWVWRQWLEDGDLELDAGERDYVITPPVGSRIVGLVEIQHEDGTPLTGYRFRPPNLRLDHAPTNAVPLNVCLALKPAPDVTSVDDALYNDWREAACAGAKFRLMTLPGKPWTNLEAAAYHRKSFDQYCRDAVRRVSHNNTGRSLQVSMRRFS